MATRIGFDAQSVWQEFDVGGQVETAYTYPGASLTFKPRQAFSLTLMEFQVYARILRGTAWWGT